MSVPRQISILTILLCGFNLTILLNIDLAQPLLPQLVLCLVVMTPIFVALYYFSKGRNWARILVMCVAILGLLGLVAAIGATSLTRWVLGFLEGAVSIYVLIFLNTRGARAFFASQAGTRPQVITRVPLAVKIGVAVVVVVGLAAGAVIVGVRTVVRNVRHMDVWIEDVRTGEAFPITKQGMNASPRFSPDGRRVVYAHSPGLPQERGSAIRVYSLDEGTTISLVDDGRMNLGPSWDPTGRHVVYASKHGGQTDLWIYVLGDRSAVRLTQDLAREVNPLWSPDGRWILFEQDNERGIGELYVMPSRGGLKRRLTRTENFLYEPKNPTWSPNSKSIAYFRFTALVLMSPEGAMQQVFDLTGLNNFKDPSFSFQDPDVILFAARPAQSLSMRFNLYRLSRRTRDLEVWKTGRGLLEVNLHLSPDGSALVYARPSGRSR